MGEIIYSFVIGGCLILAGIILITAINKESKRELKRLAEKSQNRQGEKDEGHIKKAGGV